MLGWFRAIMPKETGFFEHFVRHGHTLVAGAEALRALLDGGEAVPRYCKIIIDRENEADAITRDVLMAVRRTFITPFDRGDIQSLITSMDDAIDQMHQTAKTITLFELSTFDPAMREMGDIVVQAAKLTAEALPLLSAIGKHSTALTGLAEAITRIEDRSDQLYDQGRKQLFQAHRHGDVMAYLIGTEIYSHLEKTVDRFEDVANEISAIVVEHV